MEELLAVKRYETSMADLQNFCKKNTEFIAVEHADAYPFRVEFIPDPQMSMFPEENLDETGEVRSMMISVGLTTDVRSRLAFTVEASTLKKLIRLTESCGFYYYQAFHQKAMAKLEGEEA